MQRVGSTDELRRLLDSTDFDCGCPTASSSIAVDDRLHIAKSLAIHFVVYSHKAELDDIIRGFRILNFESLVNTHGELIKPLFVSTDRPTLTASSFLGL